MASETVADIVKRVRRDCNSYPLPTAAAEMLKLVREVEAAYQREVAELKRQREEALTIVNEVEKCASVERHTEAMLKKNEVIAGLRKEVAELREFLKVAEDELTKLQERLVSSVHDGTIDPYEALKIAETALAALRVEGGAK